MTSSFVFDERREHRCQNRTVLSERRGEDFILIDAIKIIMRGY